MKKSFLFIFFLAVFFQKNIYAQCTPSLTGPYGAISPDTTNNLPPAFVGVVYDADFQFFIPADTIVPVFGNVPVINFTLTSITGLPSGFAYTTNPASGVFPGGSAGCLRIHSVGATASQIGTHPLKVFLTVNVNVLGITTQIKDTINGYNLVINPATTVERVESQSFGTKQIFSENESFINLKISSTENSSAVLRIFSIEGKEIFSQNISLETSERIVNINSASFSKGVYLFSVETKNNFCAGKLVVTR